METVVVLWLLGTVLVGIGIAGTLVPAMPGSVLMLAGFVVIAWAENFDYVGYGTLALLAVMTLLTYLVDFVAGALGAKHFGASSRAAIGAAIGAVVGIFFGLIGILVGPFIGAVVGELTEREDLYAAGRAGIGATIGLLLGTAAKMAIAFAMVGVFLLVRFS
ncbi:MAG: DUF456 family protein [Halioglobus sp.]|nr:DUF456 family protein [Halioglobus sp.]